jgi:WhiB family transcriptional regulator, redox-sensing transcriptional regulator
MATDGIVGRVMATDSAQPFGNDGRRPGWMARGVCRGEPIETFFADRGGESYKRAQQLCARCPVRRECADFAISDPLIFGWWGGMSERERRKVRASRAA